MESGVATFASLHSHRFGYEFPATLGSWDGILRQFCFPPPSLFVNTEDEYIPDAESVRVQRERHHQPQTCTLAQCFQLYTKEERVRAGRTPGARRGGRAWPGDGGEARVSPEPPGIWCRRRFCRRKGPPSVTSFRTLSERLYKFLEKVDDGLKCSRNEPP